MRKDLEEVLFSTIEDAIEYGADRNRFGEFDFSELYKTIELFEVGTCKDCKHIRYPKQKSYHGHAKCMVGCCSTTIAEIVGDTYYEHNIVEQDFGCVKFERKSK